MSYLENIVRTFAEDITRHRKYNYSHDGLEEFLLAHPHVGCLTCKVPNNRQENLETLLLRRHNARACIVYGHGLGSNKLEALSLAKSFLKYGFDICAFDFSGSGRSEGGYTSYGLLEQCDVHAILKYLDGNHAYESYILWGRSMGSVSMVLSQGTILHRKVRCIVLDSPFSSFQKVAV